MNATAKLLCIAAVLTSVVSCKPSSTVRENDPETLVRGGYDQKEMDAAIAHARATTEEFLTVMRKGDGEEYSVKAPISENGETEHFWLTDVKYHDGTFEGLIGDEPGMVKNVKFGQPWKIKRDEISDWMYMKGGKMYGNFTLRPLLPTLDPQEAERIRSLLANP